MPPSASSDPGAEPFARAAAVLGAALDAPRLGLAAPPAGEDLARPGARPAVPQSRLRAARSWLAALGYLSDANAEMAGYDPALHGAVARFQRDAGLTVDGWIGAAQTWPRLRELVAFEAPLEAAFWARAPAPIPALERAAAARLRVYGFAVGAGAAALDHALAAFERALRAFGGTASHRTAATRLAAVLDHDRHLAAVARGASAAREVLSGDDAEARAAFGLMLNLAKVELWLAQGDGVVLPRAYRARRGLDGEWAIPRSIKGAMGAHMAWLDDRAAFAAGMRRAYGRALRRDDPAAAVALFLATAERHGRAGRPGAAEGVAELHRFYGGAGDGVPARARTTAARLTAPRSLRARLWDGVRRLWSWIGLALRRAIATGRGVLRIARQVAAYAFQVASDGLSALARAVGAFVRHLPTALRRRHLDGRRQICLFREAGRDVSIAARADVAPDRLRAWTARLALSAQIFRRAAQVIGRGVGLGLAIGKAVIAPPLILRSLIAVARDLAVLRRVGAELAILEARHDRLTAG